ncbi:hypothetical protein DPMN_021270 [Dreissena polymorpha]|uniref:Uncharacterized protein n=1 Tax=Dreissena polymorpha TaxID=45954 RepID=A0A9D4NMK6_DREPO|nr:hypothetical protein DPMN_021270 [Dreissena polymorpha]
MLIRNGLARRTIYFGKSLARDDFNLARASRRPLKKSPGRRRVSKSDVDMDGEEEEEEEGE